jgi:ABC-type nitrate/sulfonate/bicarbonate transport system substrate-binding protein
LRVDSDFQMSRCSADFAIYQLLSRNGLDSNKDVTLLSIAGSPDAGFAALIGGSVDATVVNSPFGGASSIGT